MRPRRVALSQARALFTLSMKAILLLPLFVIGLHSEPVPVKTVAGKGIMRGSEPYFVRGAGGAEKLDELAKRGGNSVRTWSTDGLAVILNDAQKNGLTVCAGVWLESECSWFSYSNPEHCARQLERVQKVVREFRGHSALLFWGLGNEAEGDGKNAAFWKQIDVLAQLVHKEDPSHPAFTAVAGLSREKAEGLNIHAPHLNFVGINTYGALPGLRKHLTDVKWTRPWVVTEFGPQGFWERPKTRWGAPLEQTSTEKAAMMQEAYQKAIAPGGDCWGGYAFLWGHKQEATSTWFGLFTPDGKNSTASVDVLEELWTGKAPDNRAPVVREFKSDAAKAVIRAGVAFSAIAKVTDPDGDSLTWYWSVVPESAGRDAKGQEKVPVTLPDCVVNGPGPSASFLAPEKAGNWRVFVQVTDGKKHAATANFPFRTEK